MSVESTPFVVAAVQVAPVFLDREATIDLALGRIREAAAAGARLAVFPECFLPAYPFWVWHVPAGDSVTLRDLYTELVENAVDVPGVAVDRLCRAALESRINVSIGVNERNHEASGTTLYNTNLLIREDGTLVARHRKLVPTGGERLVHAQGDGSTLVCPDLPIGRTSALICWENYMPLARYALYAWGTRIHLAPTWDRGEPWTSTLRHIAKEGRVYVVGCGMALRRDDVPDRLAFKARYLSGSDEWINPGDSAIVHPDGKFVAGPLHGRQEILYGEIDPRQFIGPRSQLDVAGHYARPDVFELRVRRVPKPMILDAPAPEGEAAEAGGPKAVDPGSSY